MDHRECEWVDWDMCRKEKNERAGKDCQKRANESWNGMEAPSLELSVEDERVEVSLQNTKLIRTND